MGCVTAQRNLVLHKRLNMINKHCKPRWLEFYRWLLLVYELEQLNYDLQYKAAIQFNVIIVTNTCNDFVLYFIKQVQNMNIQLALQI